MKTLFAILTVGCSFINAMVSYVYYFRGNYKKATFHAAVAILFLNLYGFSTD